MIQFDGIKPGAVGYLECILITDLDDGEGVRLNRQVDVRLPNKKVMRLPYSWLVREEECQSEMLHEMLDASEDSAPKRVVKRAAPGK